MKLLRNKETGKLRIMGQYGFTAYFDTKDECLADCKRVKRNALKREQNQMLRDLTGTSASAARKDMGV